MHSWDPTASSRMRTATRVVTAIASPVTLVCLYIAPWWSNADNSSFLDTAHELTEAYADPQERPFSATAVENMFFQWGHLLLALFLVLTVVAAFVARRWITLPVAVGALAALGWLIYAVSTAGLINMDFAPTVVYIGSAVVGIAAGLTPPKTALDG